MTDTITAERPPAGEPAPVQGDGPAQVAFALAGTTFTLLTSAASEGNRYVGRASFVGGHGFVGANAHRVRLQILESTPKLLREVVDALGVRLPPLGGGDRGLRRAIIALGQLTERAEAAGHTELAAKATRFLTRAHTAAMAATGEAHLTPYRWRAHLEDEQTDAESGVLAGAGAGA